MVGKARAARAARVRVARAAVTVAVHNSKAEEAARVLFVLSDKPHRKNHLSKLTWTRRL